MSNSKNRLIDKHEERLILTEKPRDPNLMSAQSPPQNRLFEMIIPRLLGTIDNHSHLVSSV